MANVDFRNILGIKSAIADDDSDPKQPFVNPFAANSPTQQAVNQADQMPAPSLFGLQDPASVNFVNTLKKNWQGDLSGQRDLKDQIKNNYLAQLQQPVQPDLSPLLSIASRFSGQDLTKGYKAPETQAEQQTRLQKMLEDQAGIAHNTASEQSDMLKDIMNGANMRQILGQNRLDEVRHRNIIGKLQDNKELTDVAGALQNTDQAVNILNGGGTGKVLPQNFQEAMNLAIQNIGVKGANNALSERTGQQIDAINKQWAALKQKYSNQPVDLRQYIPELIENLKETLAYERQNKYSYAQGKLSQLTHGNEDLYNRPENYAKKEAFDSLLGAWKDRISPKQSGAQAPMSDADILAAYQKAGGK